MMQSFLTFLFLYLSIWNTGRAQQTPWTLQRGYFDSVPRQYLRILLDPARSTAMPEAYIQWQQGAFKHPDSLLLPGFFEWGRYNFWIAIVVKNSECDTFPLLMRSGMLDGDSIWHFNGDRNSPHLKVIDNCWEKPASDYIPLWLTHAWVWPVAPEHCDTFLIKAYSFKRYDLPQAGDAAAYTAWDIRTHFFNKRIYLYGTGIFSVIILLGSCLTFYFRSPFIGWYSAYCFFIAYIGWHNYDVGYTWMSAHYLPLWRDTKVFLHSLPISVCYAWFIKYFFEERIPQLNRIVWVFTFFCAAAAVVEGVLLYFEYWWYSWLFYFALRNVLSLAGLVSLFLIWRLPGYEAKLIFWGMFALCFFEVLGNFFPVYGSLFSLSGVIIEFILFGIAILKRFLWQYETSLLERSNSHFQLERLQLEKNIAVQRLRLDTAQDIHDEVGGRLAKMALQAQLLAHQPLPTSEIQQRLTKIGDDAREVADSLRLIVFAITPEYDNPEDIMAYFMDYANHFWQDHPINVLVDFRADDTVLKRLVTPNIKRHLLFMYKEAQNNILKHSGATEVKLLLHFTPTSIRMEISDNGCGFDPGQENVYHYGLKGLQKRATAIGAELDVQSIPGKGTSIIVSKAFEIV